MFSNDSIFKPVVFIIQPLNYDRRREKKSLEQESVTYWCINTILLHLFLRVLFIPWHNLFILYVILRREFFDWCPFCIPFVYGKLNLPLNLIN